MKKVLENGATHERAVVNYNSKPPQGFCEDRGPDWGLADPENYRFIYADRKGPADMTTSQIIFYTERTFTGMEYVFDQSETEKLPTGPVSVQSYMLFSNDPWIVYPEANFTGKAVHLKPFGSNVPKDNFELNGFFNGIVGSVKKGINDEENDKAAGCTKTVNIVLLQMTFLAFVCKSIIQF